MEDDDKTEYMDAVDDQAIPAEPEAWDSGSEWEEKESDENGNDEDPEVEGILNIRRGHVYPEPEVALPSSTSPGLRDHLAMSIGASVAAGGTEGDAVPTDPPLHALQEYQFGEVIL